MIRLPCRPRRRGGLAVISESPNSFLLRRGRHQGSGFGGRYEKLRKWKARGDRYPPDGELEHRIPASEWVSCVGPAGTIIFCDTSGFHRGGIATTSARIVATWTFLHARRDPDYGAAAVHRGLRGTRVRTLASRQVRVGLTGPRQRDPVRIQVAKSCPDLAILSR